MKHIAYESWLEDATPPAFITMNKTIVMKSYWRPHEEGNIALYVTMGSSTVNQRLDAFNCVQHQPRQNQVPSQMPPLSSNSTDTETLCLRVEHILFYDSLLSDGILRTYINQGSGESQSNRARQYRSVMLGLRGMVSRIFSSRHAEASTKAVQLKETLELFYKPSSSTSGGYIHICLPRRICTRCARSIARPQNDLPTHYGILHCGIHTCTLLECWWLPSATRGALQSGAWLYLWF